MDVQQKILREVREFAEAEIKPHAGTFDKEGVLPRGLISNLAERGYLGASLPEQYGGLGLDPVHYGLLTEEIGKACCSTRTLLTVHTSIVGETLLRLGSTAQKDDWLPMLARGKKIAAFALSEPETGSNAKGIQTSYRKDGSHYIINGRKKWISFGDIADVFIVIASNDGKVTAFLVERETSGIETIPIQGMLAGRASHIAEILFKDVRVHEKNIIGRINGGFTYVVSTALDHGRYSIAWAGAALAGAALEAMVSYSRNRSQFGEKICNFQLVQGMIGDAVTKVHAARALCLKAGYMRLQKDPDAVMETTIAKYFTSKAAVETASDAVQIHGGNGCCDSYPAERLFRESKILEIIEGTSQIQQSIIAKFGLNHYY